MFSWSRPCVKKPLKTGVKHSKCCNHYLDKDRTHLVLVNKSVVKTESKCKRAFLATFSRLTPLLFTSHQLCMFLFHHLHHDEITIVIITVRIIMMLKSPGKKTLLRRPWRCLVSPVCSRSPQSRGNTWCDDYHYHCCYHYYDDVDDWGLPWISSIKKLGAQSYSATTPLPQEHKAFEPGMEE